MKTRIIILLISLAYITIACSKRDFQKISVEKVWKDPGPALNDLKEKLKSNPHGWEFTISFGRNKAIGYGYLGFNSENESDFISDYSINFASLAKTKYKLGIIQNNPSLLFPEKSRFADLASQALNIDTLFTFKGFKGDTIIMEGEYKNSILRLTKCTSEKLINLKKNTIKEDILKWKNLLEMPTFFYQIEQNKKIIDIEIDSANKEMTFIGGSNANVRTLKSKYYFNGKGIALVNQIEIDGLKLKELENLVLNKSDLSFDGNGKISNTMAPKTVDLNIIKDFIGIPTKRQWYVSIDGFCQRNKDDLANLKKIPNFTVLNLAPNYDRLPETDFYHWFLSINLTGLNPGSFYGPYGSITPEGTLLFKNFLESKPSEIPQVVEAMKITTSYIFNPKGLYVLRHKYGFVLVDARDGKTWAYFISG